MALQHLANAQRLAEEWPSIFQEQEFPAGVGWGMKIEGDSLPVELTATEHGSQLSTAENSNLHAHFVLFPTQLAPFSFATLIFVPFTFSRKNLSPSLSHPVLKDCQISGGREGGREKV